MIDETTTFPTALADVETSKLLEAFTRAPERFRRAVAGLDEAALFAKPRPGKWSIGQVIVHVADSEIMGATRIRQTLAQSARQFAFYSQTRWCDELQYERGGPARVELSLELFTSLRKATAFLLEGASRSDWEKTGIHPELGEISLRNLLELYADHGERHLNQIIEMRRLLNVPLSWQRLLPRDLY